MSSVTKKLVGILVASVKHNGSQPLTTQHLLNMLKAAEKKAEEETPPPEPSLTTFNEQEMEVLKSVIDLHLIDSRPLTMTDKEWKEFLIKIS
jgi:hypothetical protein